ncbi:MAG: twin-arginine translocase subunit TatC [Acidimicrobiia bacterium]|nr:twin-arginine translocase subunit TatC [Acidimicrobiia bacterium]
MTAVAVAERGRMTLVDHLGELRRRVLIAALAVAIGGVVAFFLYNQILGFLVHPYSQITHHRALIVTDPLEGFATRLKITAFGGLMLASPVVLWQLWRFITPGLHKRERRYAIPFVMASILLFCLGGAVALLTFKQALSFLVGVGGQNLTALYTPSKYLSLITLMIVAFGLSFEFPVLLVFLELAGVLSTARLRAWRRPAIVVIVAVAAIVTPSQDPYSLFAMAVPMYVFYEASILIGRLLHR